MIIRALSAAFLLLAAPSAFAQNETSRTTWPNQREGDFIIKDFRFKSGETIAELKQHYMTLGIPKRNAAGEIINAVILLHGTSSTGKAWLMPSLGDELFAAGQPLDATQYFIILPDGIGRGASSKPSDGLRAKFPHYRYEDIIAAEHQLVTEGLGIKHLRLVMGASMGGMHTWMWGYMYPDLMDGLIPIASQPIAISGRNWIQRRIAAEAIRQDPGWNSGNYEKNPTQWVYGASRR
jgi:homoserine O-acetyltransferase/O-succinyltransferase